MFRKNQIVYAKSQDYGECIIHLIQKISFNVKGKRLKSPIWLAFVLDSSMDRDFLTFLQETDKLPGFFEDFDKRNFMEVLE